MPNCENCTLEHDGFYGSGRFCDAKCARGFATKAQRLSINTQTALILKGRSTRPASWKPTQEQENNRVRAIQQWCKNQLKLWTERWLRGEEPTATTNRARTALIRIHNNRCQNCGWCEVHPVTGNVPVEIHHVDGDKRNKQPTK